MSYVSAEAKENLMHISIRMSLMACHDRLTVSGVSVMYTNADMTLYLCSGGEIYSEGWSPRVCFGKRLNNL